MYNIDMKDNREYDQGWIDCEKYFREHYILTPIDEMLNYLEKEMKNGAD